VLKDLELPLPALFSTLGRTAARGLECQWAAGKLRYFFDKLVANIKAGDLATANIRKWEPSTWPRQTKGVGFTEAPRGALGHWVHIADGRIENYQCVVPTTWNGSPRDPKGQIGAYEASLMDTPLAKADEPLEILRTLHSFDPCLACSTHVLSPDGAEMARITVR
jgi:hydrogenase large subunit